MLIDKHVQEGGIDLRNEQSNFAPGAELRHNSIIYMKAMGTELDSEQKNAAKANVFSTTPKILALKAGS